MKTVSSCTVVDLESKYAMVHKHYEIYQQALAMEHMRMMYNSYGQDPEGYANAKKAMLKGQARRVKIGKYEIETWFKREHKDWITQVRDEEGNQIGDAHYAGNKYDAAVSHCWKIIEIVELEYNIKNSEIDEQQYQKSIINERYGNVDAHRRWS